jgi:hypothetical protein
MTETGLFEVIAAEDENPRLAARQALLVAEARTDAMFGSFLKQAATPEEYDARFSYVEDDFNGVVLVACDEVGHKSPANIAQTLRDHYRPVARSQPEFVRESRVKMCPYHSEVTDISLASGNPEAGFNAMSQHAWSDNHCQGAWEGKCNFKKEMVTQSYWDDRAKAREEKKEQQPTQEAPLVLDVPDQNVEQVNETTDALPDNVIDFPSPAAESPDSGSDDLSGDSAGLTEAPLAVAASTRTADVSNGVQFVAGPTDPASLDPNSQAPMDPNSQGGVPTDAPPTPQANPEAIQNAIMTLQQAGQASGGTNHQRTQQLQGLLGQIQGLMAGGLTASWTPRDIRPILESGDNTPDSRTAAPKEFNPAEDKDPDEGKEVSCPLCGGKNSKCSRCHGKGKVADWGESTLDKVADSQNNTGLGGPEPKIDKRLWTPKNLEKIKFDDTKEKDILEPIIPQNEDALEEIGDIKHETLPTAKGLDDSGFADGGESKGPHTKTFPKGDQTDPVTKASE